MEQKQYVISEQLRIGLLEYLATRPLKEVLDGWMALNHLKPMEPAAPPAPPTPPAVTP